MSRKTLYVLICTLVGIPLNISYPPVTTSKINWPYFDRVGVSQSAAVEVHESFRVVENGNRLEYDMTVTDPPTLVEPFVWHGRWAWRPGEEVNRYDCTLEE